MRTRQICAVLTTLTLLLCASSLVAQDPWAPLPADPQALLTDGHLIKSPIKLSFPLISEGKVPAINPTHPDDLAQVYNVDFADVMAYFEKNAAKKKTFVITNPDVLPESAGLEYRIISIQDIEGIKRIFFVNKKASRDITVLVEPFNGQTRVRYENIVQTHLHSGLMPWREDFQGYTFQKPVQYNWN